LIVTWAPAQTPAVRPEFEVASIKLNTTTDRLYYKSFSNRFTARNMTAKLMTQLAWHVQSFQVSGGEGWFDSQGFDFEATTDRPVTWGQMKLMFQSLLQDRFKLAFHRQTKDALIYALVSGKNGVRMKLSPDQTPWTGDHPNEPGTTGANMDIRSGSLTGDSIPMAMFVDFLTGQVGRPVVNETGLRGRYAIDLRWSPDAAEQTDPASASLFTAIQEQLGLKLESTKGPMEMLVIDHVEKPSEN
jgi:uncharacterized protein (TIGR03435 family)